LCDCGKKAKVFADYLRSGSTKSCGCLRDDLGCKLNFKHGLCKDRNAYARYRLNTIPELKLRTNICSAIRSLLKSKNFRKNGKSILNYLPYSINELKKHLESLWEPWMNWNNYGGRTNDPRLTWHIDHIKPHSSFSYTSMEDIEFRECWALSNLQPLEKIANIKKGCKYEKI
jgi:hypothetical protein